MTRRTRPNVPAQLHKDDREVLGFLQALLDYDGRISDHDDRIAACEVALVPIGGSIKYGSATMPSAAFLPKSGQVVNKADYPALWDYAQGDGAYTTTVTTVTIPADPGFIVRAR
jgi:hypothetical protein